MHISIDKQISIPIYLQIKNQIKEMIHLEILPKGFILPAERKLANTLGVSRSTIVKAYEELKSLGLIESHIGKETRVSIPVENITQSEKSRIIPLSWYQSFAASIAPINEHTIKDIINMLEYNDIISFAAGIADPELYPIDIINKIQEKAWKSSGRYMLTHSSVEGYYPLRESISELLKLKHISVSPKEIMILSGSQQGIDFVARTFLTPGDVVFVEEPTFMGAIQLFNLTGAKIIGVPMDEEGIKTDILEILLNKYKPKFIYTLPTFQNPSGKVMSLKRRYELLELAYKYQIPIVEDDPYGEIRYEGIPILPLKALDKHDYVIYLSTFSKVLFSGMRVGWVAASPQVIKKFSMIKQITDLHANAPSQYILDSFLREGYYTNHINLICKEYNLKRNTMINALKNSKLDIDFDVPEGGYYIWCSIPKEISQTKLWVNLLKEGIIYTPGNLFYPTENSEKNYIRLNFTFENTDKIHIGINKLLDILRKMLEESSS